MSSKFVNLNEIFLPTTGGNIEGSLDINGALTVNDGSGEGTSYNIAEKISELESAFDSVSQTLKNVLATTYNPTCTITLGSNYTAGTASAELIGNCLRMYMTCTRSAASSTGDISNEVVMTININHGGKITGLYNASFINGTTGSPASFCTASSSAIDDNNMSFEIRLTGVSVADNAWNAYWVMPVEIDLSKY